MSNPAQCTLLRPMLSPGERLKSRGSPTRLAEAARPAVAPAFARQGFASGELVARWREIVGAEIAGQTVPIAIKWPRQAEGSADRRPTATLVLKADGPVAIEIQHLQGVILERVNQYFGWRAVGRLALRQGPLPLRNFRRERRRTTPEAADQVGRALAGVSDENLRAALVRLGTAIKGA